MKGEYEGWITIYESGTDYDADIVRDRLDSFGVPAVVLTQRDHAFNLTLGKMASVRVLVPPEYVEEAHHILEETISEEELEEAAMQADPHAPDAHPPEIESMLDSGDEHIRLSPPEAEAEDEAS